MSDKNAKNKTKVKKSTDELIDSAIAQQNSWMENRRNFARRFLKTLNIFARPAPKPQVVGQTPPPASAKRKGGLAAYWFPILCAVIVICIAAFVIFIRPATPVRVVVPRPAVQVAEPVVRPVPAPDARPEFDIVRIEPAGNVVVAGRWLPNKNISISINGQIVATERTDNNGDFVYAPVRPFTAGNYTISLIGTETNAHSADRVFVYISAHGYENSVSLLMTAGGSTLLQAPSMLRDGDLTVSKIDYLDTGRIVVTGDGLPRLRVSLSLNDKYLGFARVSDHRHYGLGADVGELTPGADYTLTIRLHDGDGHTVATVQHSFTMPQMTGDEDTFYTVRRGDCLWIIARNFLRRGVLFSIIADRNNIENPDLIFPQQKLNIPTSAAK